MISAATQYATTFTAFSQDKLLAAENEFYMNFIELFYTYF